MKTNKLIIGACTALLGIGCFSVLANPALFNRTDAKGKTYTVTFDSSTQYEVTDIEDGYGNVENFTTTDGGLMYFNAFSANKSEDNFITLDNYGGFYNVYNEFPVRRVTKLAIKGTGTIEIQSFLESEAMIADSRRIFDLSDEVTIVPFNIPTNYFMFQTGDNQATIESIQFTCLCGELETFKDSTILFGITDYTANFEYVTGTNDVCDSEEAIRMTPNKFADPECCIGFEFDDIAAATIAFHFDIKYLGEPTDISIAGRCNGSEIKKDTIEGLTSSDNWYHIDKTFEVEGNIDEIEFYLSGTPNVDYVYIDNLTMSFVL